MPQISIIVYKAIPLEVLLLIKEILLSLGIDTKAGSGNVSLYNYYVLLASSLANQIPILLKIYIRYTYDGISGLRCSLVYKYGYDHISSVDAYKKLFPN